MLGSAIKRRVAEKQSTIQLILLGRDECDLEDRAQVKIFLNLHEVDAVIHTAAVVGGIQANINEPSRFLDANIRINSNIIGLSAEMGIEKLLFLGSSCMYPKDYKKPLKEEYILNAPLEPTNEGYALSKIVGARHAMYISKELKFQYKTVIPCNLYGPNDNFEPVTSHLVPSIIRKIVEAKKTNARSLDIWGDGSARREFLYIDELADFLIFNIQNMNFGPEILNIGMGLDYSVREYYEVIAELLDCQAEFIYDHSKPVGMKQKLLDISHARQLGWTPNISLAEGLQRTIKWYKGE